MILKKEGGGCVKVEAKSGPPHKMFLFWITLTQTLKQWQVEVMIKGVVREKLLIFTPLPSLCLPPIYGARTVYEHHIYGARTVYKHRI